MICPYLQMFRFQEALEVAQEQFVLENAAGEHNRISSEIMRKRCDTITKSFCNSALKCAGNFAGIAAVQPVSNHAAQERAEVQFAVFERKRVGVRRERLVGKMFQPHRCLTLEGNFASETEQGRRRIEESSHGRGAETAHLCSDQLQGVAIARRE